MYKVGLILLSYINLLKDKLSIIDPEKRKLFKSRIDICNNCLYKTTNIFFSSCSICGCPIKSKTRANYKLDKNGITIDGCPKKYW